MPPSTFRGTVVKWNDERGFGFICPDADRKDQIFLHIKEVRRATRRPVEGDIVTFALQRQSDGKMRAYDVHIQGAEREFKKPISPGPLRIAAVICVAGTIAYAVTFKALWVILPYPIASLISVRLYFLDKRAANEEQWRISESTLLAIDFLGGWPGGAFAQYAWRHKIMKPSFQTPFRAIVTVHTIAWILLLALLAKYGQYLGSTEFRETVLSYFR